MSGIYMGTEDPKSSVFHIFLMLAWPIPLPTEPSPRSLTVASRWDKQEHETPLRLQDRACACLLQYHEPKPGKG